MSEKRRDRKDPDLPEEEFQIVDRRRFLEGELPPAEKAELLKGEANHAKSDSDREDYLRLLADFDNFRRRAREEQKSSFTRGENEVFRSLFPLFSALEKAYQAGESGAQQKVVQEGLRIILTQWSELLKRSDIVATAEVGSLFDPKYHEVVLAQDAEEPEGTILEVYRQGYRRGTEALVTAKVRVAREKRGEGDATLQGAPR